VNFDIVSKLYSLPGIIIGLTIHEYAHAWAAYRLGDRTAKEDGRLTLNPLKHIDPIGFIFLFLAGFGWAKPVRFTRESLSHPKRDEAIIAVAGPLSNLLAGIVFCGLLALVFFKAELLGGQSWGVALRILLDAISINFGLFVFNLIPIPPLDGSHLFFSALRLQPSTEATIYRYGSIALIFIVVLGSRTGIDILPIGRLVSGLTLSTLRLFGLPLS
jgi:Zn-dependent protease